MAARLIAKSIANSPLVKTAIAGEDPNWGRIVAAVGKAGEAADRDKLAIWLGDTLVARDGEVAPSYREQQGAAYMKGPEIAITVGTARDKTTAIARTIPRLRCVKFMLFPQIPRHGEVRLRWAGMLKSEAIIGNRGCGPRSRGCDYWVLE